MKEEADYIIRSKYVITLDSEDVIRDGGIVVKDGEIIAVGRFNEISSRYEGELIEKPCGITTPGFIDCHTHTQQILLRSFIGDEWLQLPPVWTKLLVPFERSMSPDLALFSTKLSIYGMLRNGTTAFVEAASPFPDILAEWVVKSGIRGFITPATYNISEEIHEDPDKVFERVADFYSKYAGKDPRLKIWMSLRQVMMASDDLIEKIIDYALKHETGFTMHLAEYQGEVDFTLGKTGKRPLEYMLERGVSKLKNVILAHAVFLSPSEVEIIRKLKIGICWCPTIDSWLMGPHWIGLSNIRDLNIGIGSDGGAWNRLDLLHESKVAKALGKGLAASMLYYKAGLDSRTIMRMLTGNRGELVGEKIGVLKPGYRADIVVFDACKALNLPVHDPIEAVVNYLEGDSITDVFVEGKHIVADGRVLTISEEDLLKEYQRIEPELTDLLHRLRERIKFK
ncbi:amidohydrolase family protein [Thermogladius sp. 4427co]|uniref:amidohydrolase family protein n=1 Tax=Thermogladius sp. 4427co TaxID=3450718 RepID=UPI003F7A31C8